MTANLRWGFGNGVLYLIEDLGDVLLVVPCSLGYDPRSIAAALARSMK